MGPVSLVVSLFLISAFLLLYIYARFHLRRAIGQVSVTVAASLIQSMTEPLPKTGLDPSLVFLLPLVLYSNRMMMGAAECAVCLSGLEEEEMVRLLPNCNHLFHARCVDVWLSSRTTCPLCRTEAEPAPAQKADGSLYDHAAATAKHTS